MCIPPADVDPKNYFIMLKKNSEILNLKDLTGVQSSLFSQISEFNKSLKTFAFNNGVGV